MHVVGQSHAAKYKGIEQFIETGKEETAKLIKLSQIKKNECMDRWMNI